MSHRPLVLVSGLTLGDYLLWNWSLNGNHTVIALIAGLTLPPLALATLWLVAIAAGRLLARTARRPAGRRSTGAPPRRAARPAAASRAERDDAGEGPSHKIAA